MNDPFRISRIGSCRIVALTTAVILPLVSGCASLLRQSEPDLARRPYTETERVWLEYMKEWYPEWRAPVLPMATRDLEPPPMRIRNPAPVSWPPSRAGSTQLASQSGATVADLPVPVVDYAPAGPPPAARESFQIIPENRINSPWGPANSPGQRFHRVRKGETLMSIAGKLYGNKSAWKKIYDANRDVISNPNRVKSGTSLRIP